MIGFRAIALCITLACAVSTAPAQNAPPHPDNATQTQAHPAAETPKPPPDRTTHHTLELPGRTLRFAGTAGTIRLSNDAGVAQADVAFIAWQLEDTDTTTRPVTFVFNGGPGQASGWLHVGALGPWRVPLGVPSGSPEPLPNAETWLDFTDLIFIDPPGTGYSRILTKDDDARRHFWSVNGDIEALSEVIRRWLDRNDRILSPKYIVGESYGGFRGPRLARALQSEQGVGVTGLVLVSPVLDIHTQSGYNDPLSWSDVLPALVATVRTSKGPVSRADLADVEQYAAGDYLVDLLRGFRDTAAVARMSDRLAAFTGIDRAIIARGVGRLDNETFVHELDRAKHRVGSLYDPTVEREDPFPRQTYSNYPDPMLEGLKAPITSAMVAIYNDKLNWRPDGVYHLANDAAFREWNWGRGMGRPESLSYLQEALSLDPRLHVLIAHGLFDMVTPYFTTVRLLNLLPGAGSVDRIHLIALAGGHMFYSNDASRSSFQEAAKALYQPK
jgi:carboxypeptidase C (cathepsin A)